MGGRKRSWLEGGDAVIGTFDGKVEKRKAHGKGSTYQKGNLDGRRTRRG